MAEWRDYRMWYRRAYGVANSGSSGFWLGDWRASDHLFRGRTQAEAQKKADRFWRDCQFGMGSMFCIPADETLSDAHFQQADKP